MDTSPGANNLPEDEELEDDWVNDQQSLEDKRCAWCKEINAKKHLIICNTCHIPYHKTCVKVTRAQAKVFKNYKCPPCRNINNITPNQGWCEASAIGGGKVIFDQLSSYISKIDQIASCCVLKSWSIYDQLFW